LGEDDRIETGKPSSIRESEDYVAESSCASLDASSDTTDGNHFPHGTECKLKGLKQNREMNGIRCTVLRIEASPRTTKLCYRVQLEDGTQFIIPHDCLKRVPKETRDDSETEEPYWFGQDEETLLRPGKFTAAEEWGHLLQIFAATDEKKRKMVEILTKLKDTLFRFHPYHLGQERLKLIKKTCTLLSEACGFHEEMSRNTQEEFLAVQQKIRNQVRYRAESMQRSMDQLARHLTEKKHFLKMDTMRLYHTVAEHQLEAELLAMGVPLKQIDGVRYNPTASSDAVSKSIEFVILHAQANLNRQNLLPRE